MQNVTLIIAVILVTLVLNLRPRKALVIYIASLLWYPSYLAVSIGTIDIVLGRFVVGALFLRCLCDDKIRTRFKWSRLDKWVALSMIIYVGITFYTRPTWMMVENRGGFIMDTWLAYMVARFIITDRASLIYVVKSVSIILLPLAILGCIEAVSGWQPFVPLRRFSPWNPEYGVTNVGGRWGFTRAIGPFQHPIMFGGCFAMFLPLIWYLRYEKKEWKSLAYIFSVTAVVGALSSMSSGPWIMIIAIVFCFLLERRKKWVKPALFAFIILCILIQISSSTAFYYVLFNYGSKLGGAGLHRAMLIDIAIKNFDQWWLVGTKGLDPGWGHYFHMDHTDVTNEYLLAGIKYGILGIIVLCCMLFVAFKQIIAAYKKAITPETKSLYWSLGSGLFAIVVVWTSVSFFGQLMPLFYCVFGMTGSSVLFLQNSKRTIVNRKLRKLKKVVVLQNTCKV